MCQGFHFCKQKRQTDRQEEKLSEDQRQPLPFSVFVGALDVYKCTTNEQAPLQI